MIALIQRVHEAKVVVDDCIIGTIQQGILAFIGIEKTDTQAQADRLLQRLLGYRIFADTTGKMNLSVQTIQGGLLLVPQFTLAANTQKGMRPSFASAAAPETAKHLFNHLIKQAQQQYPHCATGQFGADMQVHLVNDGPVTFWLKSGN